MTGTELQHHTVFVYPDTLNSFLSFILYLHYRSDHYKLIQIRVVNLQSGNGQDGLQVLHLLTDASEDDFFF